MAGICKHKGSWAAVNAKDYFGKFGFTRPVGKKSCVAHLYYINHRALLNKLEKKEGKYRFDFDGKILATGTVTMPLSIRANSWSKKVEEKLKQAGGDIAKLREEKAVPQKESAKPA